MLKTRWLIMPILLALVILPRLSIDLYLSALPDMARLMGTSEGLLQMTLTVFMFGYALSMLLAGPLSDIIGRKRVIYIGLTLYLIATFACAVSTSIVALIIARFFQALGGCCGTVV
jgi:MFS transporter, DHA1 family, multidrug resistance protein